MPYDETLAAALRDALAGHGNIGERKMFGGLCFLLDGNMVAGAYRDRGMVRVGKAKPMPPSPSRTPARWR